ncbi:MAG: FAD-dependent oxidoreductase [Coriobacteriales bacterium]|jgi:succinate dehydrogenase/fumarate reductase flavoprotein subunit|nr:FAD-dependent oxidoreductase [Coriobacteriales bacterium]
MDTGTSMDRRSFLKGASVAGAAVAATAATGALGLSGCAPSREPAAASAGGGGGGGLILDAESFMGAKWSFEIAPDPVPEEEIARSVDCEILVIGAGVSGLVTAASAVEEGTDVVIVAQSSGPVSRGGSNAAFNTRLTHELGLDYTREEIEPIFQSIFAANSFRLDQDKWWLVFDESGMALNWLMDKMVPYGISTVIENNQQDGDGPLKTLNVSHSFVAEGNQAAGASQQIVVEALAEEIVKGKGRIFYDTVAVQLDRADNNTGRVTGCVVRQEGEYVRYTASKGVVLATGDFSQDRDMVAKYCPIALPFGNGGVYDGSGLKMALWIGAAWQKYTPNAPMLATMGDEVLPCRWWAEGALTTFPGLLVNNKGLRYSNENCTYGYMPYPQRVQPDGCAYLVWDDAWVAASAPWQGDRVGGDARDTQEVYDAMAALFDPDTDWTTTDEYAGFDATMAETAVKADTLEELADGLGLPREAFLAQVERYNGYCETGLDDEFHKNKRFLLPVKTPPFYGVKNEPYTLCITGGLNTDIQMHVCDSNNDPIEGLYGIGTVVGDMYGDVYDYRVPGINLGGACTTFGYLLGKNLSSGAW